MNMRSILTNDDYQAVLKEISPMFENEPEPGTPEGDFFEAMITLIEAYETKHFPME